MGWGGFTWAIPRPNAQSLLSWGHIDLPWSPTPHTLSLPILPTLLLLLLGFLPAVSLLFFSTSSSSRKRKGAKAGEGEAKLVTGSSAFWSSTWVLWLRGKFPPGPWGLPFFGSLPNILRDGDPHRRITDLAEIYGPVMGMRLGRTPTVVLSSPAAARQVLRDADMACASRPAAITSALLTHGPRDLVFAPYGPPFVHRRKLATSHLFTAERIAAWRGVRADEAEGMVTAVVDEIAAAEKAAGKATGKAAAQAEGSAWAEVEIRPHLARVSLNNILRMSCGRRYQFSRPGKPDALADEVNSVIFKIAGLLGPFNYVDHVAECDWFDKWTGGVTGKCRVLAPKLQKFFRGVLDDHRRMRREEEGKRAKEAQAAAAAEAEDNGTEGTDREGGQRRGVMEDASTFAPLENPEDPERDFLDVLLMLQKQQQQQQEQQQQQQERKQMNGAARADDREDSKGVKGSVNGGSGFGVGKTPVAAAVAAGAAAAAGSGLVVDDVEITSLLQDLLVAGTDTAAVSTEWALAELVNRPDAMKRLQTEIDVALEQWHREHGSDKIKSQSDLEEAWEQTGGEALLMRLPYLQAVVKEMLRMHPPGAFLIAHSTTGPVDLCSGRYRVPAGTMVLVNVWSISRDPSLWPEPDRFVPERFLPGEVFELPESGIGEGVKRIVGEEVDMRGFDFRLLPFGSGRRMCVGQRLGHQLVTIMLGRLVHAFNWEAPVTGSNKSDCNGSNGGDCNGSDYKGGECNKVDLKERYGLAMRMVRPLKARASLRVGGDGRRAIEAWGVGKRGVRK
ncbi:unnamed protein product [Closterium sp. Yama58-4]|nr:unnamed protein product [Closterium sp. Yama58-4]